MSLAELLAPLQREASFQGLVERLRQPGAATERLSIADAAQPYALAALHAALRRPLLLVVARPGQARELREEIACWHSNPGTVLLFPAQDALPYEPLPPDQQLTAERLAVLSRLVELRARPASAPAAELPPLVIASVRAAADLLAPPERYATISQRLRVGDTARPDELMQRWLELGYEPAPIVDAPGLYSRRGGIVDVYPLVGEPCRIEFFGDEIESLRAFDPLTQRSTHPLAELQVPPVRDSDGGGGAPLVEYLPEGSLVALEEPASLAAAANELERQAEEVRLELLARAALAPDAAPPYLPWEQLAPRLERWPGPRLRVEHDPDAETVRFVAPTAYGGRLRHFLAEAGRLAAGGQRVVIVTQQAQRLGELLLESTPDLAPDPDESGKGAGLPAGPTRPPAGAGSAQPRRLGATSPWLIHGQLQAGWSAPDLGLTVFTDSDIFGWQKVRRPSRPRRPAGRQTLLTELTPGDLVVHVEHGIARFGGLVTMSSESQGMRAEPSAEGSLREYLILDYADGDRLYVPADQADRVSRYIGAGDATPNLTRLRSGEWQRARGRVRRAVRQIAEDLLELYARRAQADGFAYPSDSAWQAELEASFPYVETPDQLRALAEVKQDMEQPQPMDRLLVGDVGYGKTEIALRAAFKTVEAGRQVAVLVPTTVLAQQHWNTFRERLAAFPVRVEMLSRFRDEREQRQVVAGLADGSVDICIGTHRLLQKDVAFKNLGLVIVDEEQRFGVTHKERLKQLRSEVDVLTLSATPIPRTLHMALVGVRDMSSIETPPEERLPIRTYVAQYDDGLVREVILRELDRGGQVYYVHNRVQSIAAEANRLSRLVPEARIAVGHGQMPEDDLERVMLEFADGQHDVLVCTTIIESGLDIPSVNTLIVTHADRFGLSQLYQLRGRVGRGALRAYAYFFYARDTALTEVAEKRLRTIFEATELGAGFRIALKDLEIRGAGNLLGAEQHGNISAVGFDLYTRLLAEAVRQLQTAQALVSGGPPPPKLASGALALPGAASLTAPTSVSLPLAAHLPPEYVADEATRLELYQRLAAVSSGPALTDLVDELEDRFGPLPAPAQNLVYIVGLRLTAQRAGVQRIQALDGEIVVQLERLPPIDLAGLARQVGAPLRSGSNQLRLPRDRGQSWLNRLQTLVEALPRIESE